MPSPWRSFCSQEISSKVMSSALRPWAARISADQRKPSSNSRSDSRTVGLASVVGLTHNGGLAGVRAGSAGASSSTTTRRGSWRGAISKKARGGSAVVVAVGGSGAAGVSNASVGVLTVSDGSAGGLASESAASVVSTYAARSAAAPSCLALRLA